MTYREQQTIARPAEVSGIAFLSGADVRLRFLPAGPREGISFVRTDLAPAIAIPALVEHVVPSERRTTLSYQGSEVGMVEHVMAALAGLQIDNCRVEVDCPEPPGCDGSSLAFAEALLDAGIVRQGVPRELLVIRRDVTAGLPPAQPHISLSRTLKPGWTIGYALDYGSDSPIVKQSFAVEITPESFMSELAFARTFLLESEARQMHAAGFGRRTTYRDLLIFGPNGPIDNELRADDECARHKVLDCLGDLALLGCDVSGRLEAVRTGHRLNSEIARRVRLAHQEQTCECRAKAA